MIYSKKSENSIEMIQNQIAEKAKKEGFGVLKQYNFKNILKEKGFAIENDITVFELCNPQAAQEALTAHPEVSVYLPCRISLYQQGTTTVISTIGLEDIIRGFSVDEKFKSYMQETFLKLQRVIDSLG